MSKKSKVEYRIPGILWFLIAILTFLVGVFFQKNLILQGNTKFLGIINLDKKINNVSPASFPTKIYQKFNLEKDLGTIEPLGDENAKVKLVLFSDFMCAYCAALAGYNQKTIDQLKSQNPNWESPISNIITDYIDIGKAVLYFRNSQSSANSGFMSSAARCANEQDQFWNFHDRLFALQGEDISADPNGKMREIASDLNLDVDRFSSCLEKEKYSIEIASDVKRSQELGIFGKPHMFINDKYIVGVESYDKYKKIIDEELLK